MSPHWSTLVVIALPDPNAWQSTDNAVAGSWKTRVGPFVVATPVTSRLAQTGHHCLAVHTSHVVGYDALAWPELPPVTTLPLSRHFY